MKPSFPHLIASLTLLSFLAFVAPIRGDGVSTSKTDKVDFNRDIRPILAETCFPCHGPDSKQRKADLRLDSREDAIKQGSLVPGKSGESEVYLRLVSSDPKKLMPPAKAPKKLTGAQISLLKRWIDEGANYSQHWAFVPPQNHALPAVKNASWPRNPIDRFILAKLEREGMTPSPETDKITLLRRVTLDLTGLPPTISEVDAFLADQSDNAYEKVVDRLLKSPRYGEHMGRFWLDLARYGDTHGLHLDNFREMWPYRDWVINAFNTNMPYDRFLKEQIAGDLLPNPRIDQLVATGFTRAHVTTSEGGVIEEEVHIQNVNDRVETVGTVALGLTMVCAKCHDHKYDPIKTKDFYSLSAYFNSLEGSPLDGNAARHAPVIPVPSTSQEKSLSQIKAELADLKKQLEEKSSKLVYDESKDPPVPTTIPRQDFVWIDEALPQGAKTIVGGNNLPWIFVSAPAPVHKGKQSLKVTSQGLAQCVIEGTTHPLRAGEGDRFFAHVFLDPKNPPKEIMLQWHTSAWSHRAYWGENLIDWGKDQSSERRQMGKLPPVGQWVKLEVPLAQVGINPNTVINGWAFTQHGGTVYWDHSGINSAVPQSGPDSTTFSGWLATQNALKGQGLPDPIKNILTNPQEKRSPEQKKQVKDYFTRNVWPKGKEALRPLQEAIAKAEASLKKTESEIPVSYIFKEAKTPRQTFILKRGEYDKRGDPVQRELPGFLGPVPAGGANSRLGLVEWLLAPTNPLPARVAANRFWQQIFGTGIVKTAEDFGIQGDLPSHPELLDWLAMDFRTSGWDVKRLMRQLVTSSTYRQSSHFTKESLARDPANRLLSRGPRFRMDAESLRDQALFLSGLLMEKQGGPSVKPPQPPGLWEAVGYTGSNTARFSPDTGHEKIHRRSLYTFWKRTAA
ncbi:MAG: PSD1 and planctomycete cytochrome C domain-containing protein, partial [Gemmataceae bacterium]